jgi:hypothetical protein
VPKPKTDADFEAKVAALLQVDPTGIVGQTAKPKKKAKKATKKAAKRKKG